MLALAPLLLGEWVGWRRWAAAGVGFAGAIYLTRPSGTADWIYLLPLFVALLLGLRDILMRRIVGAETSISLVFVSNIVTMILGLPTVFLGWAQMGTEYFALLALLGVFFAIAQVLMIECFRYAETAAVVPFRYTSVVWAVVLGYFVWNQIPDAWGFLSIALVVSSGLLIVHREARARDVGRKSGSE